VFGPLAKIQAQERAPTFWAAAAIFLVLIAHALLETARDALYLSHLPASNLPWIYLVLAATALLSSRLVGHSGRAESDRRALVALQVAAAAGTLLFWVLTRDPSPRTFYALYIWGGLASTLILVRFWLLLGDRFAANRAKILFPIIAAGPVLGALVGYALAGALSRSLPAANLLLVSAGFFLCSALASFGLRAPAIAAASRPHSPPVDRTHHERHKTGELRESAFRALGHPYVRRLALLLILASVTVTIGDFLFKSVVADTIEARRLGAFLSTTYLAIDAISVVILLLAGPLVRALGVTESLAIQPALQLAAGVALALSGGLWPVLLLRGVDGALRWSLSKTAAELLYVPMAPQLRSTVKEVSDIVAHRGGQALASLLILALLALHASTATIAIAVVAGAALWLVVAASMRRPYLGLFRETLANAGIETRLEFPDLDIASLETLIGALNSADDARVIAAMDLLRQADRPHLIPALILYHPSAPVVEHALDLFAETRRDDCLAITERLLAHPEPAVRAAAMRLRSRTVDDAELVRASDATCPVVAATAIVARAAAGTLEANAALSQLEKLMASPEDGEEVRRWTARALCDHPSPGLSPVLITLAETPDPATQRAALQAMRAAPERRYEAVLIRLLAQRELREAARNALLAAGAPALQAVERALGDSSLPRDVRVHLPRTISRFPQARAAEILTRHLLEEPSGQVRYKILRGLGRMIADRPDLALDTACLDTLIQRQLEKIFAGIARRVFLQQAAAENAARQTVGQHLLVDLLSHRETLAVERLFRTIGLRYRGENVARIYLGLASEDSATRASSLELLHTLLPRDLREAVVSLVDELPDEARLSVGAAYHDVADDSTYEEMILSLCREPSVSVRSLATYHAAELGLEPDGTERGGDTNWPLAQRPTLHAVAAS